MSDELVNMKSHEYSAKGIRKLFKENGVFYTDPELAETLKSYLPDDLTEVYDPTCGNGSLLSVFPDSVAKFGQEIDPKQAELAAQNLKNADIKIGDTLKLPYFLDKKFRGIVANPPYSIKWQPELVKRDDERFCYAPCLPPRGKADYAFILHILHYLAVDGVASVLCFPGILYRSQREGKIREWLIRANFIDRIKLIKGGHFSDTKISTALMVLKKDRTEDFITIADEETHKERKVPIKEIAKNDYVLIPSLYLPPKEEQRPKINPMEIENEAQAHAIRRVELEIELSLHVADIEGYNINNFLKNLSCLITKYQTMYGDNNQ